VGLSTREKLVPGGVSPHRILSMFLEFDPMMWGTVGSLMVFLGTWQSNSPFVSKIPGSWFIGVSNSPSQGNAILELVARWLVYLGMAIGLYVWSKTVFDIYNGKCFGSTYLWTMFALWITPLMLSGPLLSRDVYSYAAQAEMVRVGISPYLQGPIALGHSPFLPTVDPLWMRAPAPYGPVFLYVGDLFVHLAGNSPLGTVVLLRLAALAGVILTGIYAPRIASINGYSKDAAFVLSALNPIFLYDLASAGHNDAWMVGLMVFGVYLAYTDRFVWASVVVTLAGLVKAPAFAALVFIGVLWGGFGPLRRKIRYGSYALLIGAITTVVLGVATGLGVGWIRSLSTPGASISPADPVTAAATLIHEVGSLVGVPVSTYLYLSAMRLLALFLSGVIALYLLLISNEKNWLRNLGLSLLVVVLLGPVIWPWYLSWAIALLACSVGRYGGTAVVGSSILAFPLSMPGGQSFVALVTYLLLAVVLIVFVLYRKQSLPYQMRLVIDEYLIRAKWFFESEFKSRGTQVGSRPS
jgi:alpha-1,6-mannosyltransferase